MLLGLGAFADRSYAQDISGASTALNDSGLVRQWVQLDTNNVSQYLKNPAFNYHELEVPQTWWDRLKLWLLMLLTKLFTHEASQPILKWGLILLGGAALAYLIMKLSGMDFGRLFSPNAGEARVLDTAEGDNIHEINFDQELQLAIQHGDFKLAVRLLYLKGLKKLTDAQYIKWQPGKTNLAYLNELSGTPLNRPFNVLTRQFEFIWYGDFPINEQKFNGLKESFTQFYKEVR